MLNRLFDILPLSAGLSVCLLFDQGAGISSYQLHFIKFYFHVPSVSLFGRLVAFSGPSCACP